jgi:hypothetical protein
MNNHALADDNRSGNAVKRERPLVGHPELEIVSTRLGDGWVREYKVDNFRTLKSGRIISGHEGWQWFDLALMVLAFWLMYDGHREITETDWVRQGWNALTAVSRFGVCRIIDLLLVFETVSRWRSLRLGVHQTTSHASSYALVSHARPLLIPRIRNHPP